MKLNLELLSKRLKTPGTVGTMGTASSGAASAVPSAWGLAGTTGNRAQVPAGESPAVPVPVGTAKASSGAVSPKSPWSPAENSKAAPALVPANDAGIACAPGPFVLVYEVDGQTATCVDPVSESLAAALADLMAMYGPRLGRVPSEPGKSRDEMLATVFVGPSLGAAAVIAEMRTADKLDITALCAELKTQQEAVHKGNLSRAESMLVTQAHTLDTIFNALARRAALNLGEHMGAVETYLRLALRAQGQCRATLETLAAIKNPPVVIARQANFAAGHQQINNGSPAGGGVSAQVHAQAHARAGENGGPSNELLEDTQHGERLDTGATGTAGRADPAMATVGAVHRTKDGGR